MKLANRVNAPYSIGVFASQSAQTAQYRTIADNAKWRASWRAERIGG